MSKLISDLNLRECGPILAKWGFLWLFIYGFNEIALKPNHINYQDGAVFLSLYFLSWALYIIYYHTEFTSNLRNLQKIQICLVFLALYLSFTSMCLLANQFFPASPDKIHWFREIGVLFPIFSISTSISKSADVFLQQVLILALVIKLKKRKVVDKNALILFSGFFFLLHIPLIVSMSYSAFLFIVPSLFAGFLFCYLILKIKNGWIYSSALHLGFYFLLGCVLRLV